MKNIFHIISVIIILSSCSGNKFLNRKHTPGIFTEHKVSLKHNTIYSDTIFKYASLDNRIELKKSPEVLPNDSKNEIIALKVKSILKKDSIFIKVKKGKDQKTIKANSLNYNVITRINIKGVIISQKTEALKKIDPEVENNEAYKQIKTSSNIALVFCVIPFLGFVIAVRLKKKFKAYKINHPTENLHKCSSKVTTAFVISSIIASYIIATVLGFLFFVIAALLLAA
jgi:hypothetical protein